MAYERWKQVVYDKNITEEESLAFYTTWANNVSVTSFYLDNIYFHMISLI